MEIYQIVVITLILLAIADLIVGVSNDAVNFLNSAIGSKVAGRNTILIVAGAGVLFGALSSSGMMEIARKGIFNPEVFSFNDVMVIFVAVMVADILLLDIFNSLGLPTSTTVSIVFDLLGAAVAVAIWKSIDDSSGWAGVVEAINYSTATAIIIGIFLSIGVAFSVGAIVQYLCRLWFSFRIDRYMKSYGSIFAGISITIIVYFMLIKGAKESAFIDDNVAAFISANVIWLICSLFIVALIFIFLMVKFANVHPLKIVVFVGTFALAMAFAGNDLVNFIGVPLAGYQSFQIWSDSGIGPNSFMMDQLGEAVQTPFIFLFLAGCIMVITLWFSGKARKVTETEVSLGRQDSGDESFQPNFLSRVIVGGALSTGNWLARVLPNTLVRKMNLRFYQNIASISDEDRPAFDLVRASVNLIVASLLIALATSYKLPLSTTYVSFMVAMGTSMADKAWGRESAVFRVAGVLKVITGWLFTAFLAFCTAGVFATSIYFGGQWVGIALSALALLMFVRSNIRFNKKEKALAKVKAKELKPEKQERLFEGLKEDVVQMMVLEMEAVNHAFKYLKKEKHKPVKKMNNTWKKFSEHVKKMQKVIHKGVLKKTSHSEEYSIALLYNQHHMEDLKMNLQGLTAIVREHEKNHQALPEEGYMIKVLDLRDLINKYGELVMERLQNEQFGDIDDFIQMKRETQALLQKALSSIILNSSQKKISYKQAMVLSEFVLILKNIVAIKGRIFQNYQRGKDAENSFMDVLI